MNEAKHLNTLCLKCFKWWQRSHTYEHTGMSIVFYHKKPRSLSRSLYL